VIPESDENAPCNDVADRVWLSSWVVVQSHR